MNNTIESGLSAEDIRNAPVYRDARESVKKAINNSIASLPLDGKPETDRRRDLYFCMLKCVDMIDKQLLVTMATGKVEEKKIANFEKPKRFAL